MKHHEYHETRWTTGRIHRAYVTIQCHLPHAHSLSWGTAAVSSLPAPDSWQLYTSESIHTRNLIGVHGRLVYLVFTLKKSAELGWNPASSSTLRISVARPVADTHLESREMPGYLEDPRSPLGVLLSLSPRLPLVQQPCGNPPPTAAARPAKDT